MDSEGRSPLSIFHHAPIILSLHYVLFLSTESLPTTRSKIPAGKWEAASANRFGESMRPLRLRFSERKRCKNVPLRLECSLRRAWSTGEMNRLGVPFRQCNHEEDSVHQRK